jgi:hypothetical protein
MAKSRRRNEPIGKDEDASRGASASRAAPSREAPRGLPWLLELQQEGANEDAGDVDGALPRDTLGIALSGGGIRSATFCLGVLQSLARAGWLKHVDYLSTVSGGGYVGAFVGRWFDLCHKPGGLTGAVPNRTPGAAQRHVADGLADSRSAPIDWLRRHANYLSPTGAGDAMFNLAAFWRGFLSLLAVLGVFFFALFGVMSALGYGPWARPVAEVLSELGGSLAPLSARLPASWSGTWGWLIEFTLWLAVAPLMLAYWLVSQDRHEHFVKSVLLGAALLAVVLLVGAESVLGLAVVAAAVLWAIEAFVAVRRREGHGHPESRFRLALTRNHLTRRLAFWLPFSIALLALGVIDGLGQWLARRMLEGGLTLENVARWFGGIGASLFVAAPLLRGAAAFFATTERGSLLKSAAKIPFLPELLMLLLGAFVPLVAFSFAGHAAYGVGCRFGQGLALTLVAIVVCFLLGGREALPFVNRSSPLTIYAARLARAFFGALNPARRQHVEGRNVTYLVAGDDVPFHEYAPHRAGGPLHIVNVALNETIDVASQRGQRDRQA